MKNSVLRSVLLSFLIPVCTTSAQTINTIVGSGTHTGFTCTGCPATSTELYGPEVALDKYGNVYTPDHDHNTIHKINSAGIITTIAGNGTPGYGGDGGPASAAALNGPGSITFDYKGNMFFYDGGNYVIRRIDTNGIITTYAGNGNMGWSCDSCDAMTSDFSGATSLVADKTGNLYFGASFTYKIDTARILTRFEGSFWPGYWDSTMDGVNALHYKTGAVFGIAPDDSGNVFIALTSGAGTGISKIIKVNTAGIVSTVAGSDTATAMRDGAPATAGWVFAGSLTMDTAGNFYFYEYEGFRVRKITRSTGIVNTIIGTGVSSWYSGYGDGGAALAARVAPNGDVAVDRHGDVYITDYDRIRKVYNSTASIPDVDNEALKIELYPNPATNEITITSASRITHIELLNPTGQVLLSKNNSTEKALIDIANLPIGIYFIKVNNSQVVRFLKE